MAGGLTSIRTLPADVNAFWRGSARRRAKVMPISQKLMLSPQRFSFLQAISCDRPLIASLFDYVMGRSGFFFKVIGSEGLKTFEKLANVGKGCLRLDERKASPCNFTSRETDRTMAATETRSGLGTL